MKRSEFLASLASAATAKPSAVHKAGKNKQPNLRPSLQQPNLQSSVQKPNLRPSVQQPNSSTIPEYVKLFDQGRWDDLNSYLKLNMPINRLSSGGEDPKGLLLDHSPDNNYELGSTEIPVSEKTLNEIGSFGVKQKPVAVVIGTPTNTPLKDDSHSNLLEPVLPVPIAINFEDFPNSPESVASVNEDNNDPDYDPIMSGSESSGTESCMTIGSEIDSLNSQGERDALLTKCNEQNELSPKSQDVDCYSVVPETPEKEENRPILSTSDEHCTEANLEQSFLDDSFSESGENEKVIKLNKVNKNERGLITRNKGHCCMFCNKIMINLARHLELKHDKELEVAKLIAMPKTSRARRQGFTELSRIGDYYNNLEVLTKGCGELILVRRPSPDEDQFNYNSYGPCPYCLGFMMKKHLWHHSKYSCTVKEKRGNKKNGQNVITESKILLCSSLNTDLPKEFVENILSHMREDDISNTVKDDPTVVKYGVLQFEKYGLTQSEMIRQHMRQLGRLILALQDETLCTDGDKKKLSVWLHPSNFDSLVLGVRTVCIQDEKNSQTLRPEFKIPSLALKLGHSLRKCISIERGVALRSCNKERNEELKDLMNLLELEWTVKISSNALATMNTRRMNKTKILPLTNDLVKLNNFIMSELKKDSLEWSRLAELTLCKIVLFNKRRSGEASKLTLSTYTSKTDWINEGTQETNMCLSDLEKKLASRLGLIEIRGKRGRTVPIILTPEVKENLDILISKREEAGVAKENPYVFARVGGSLLHLRGHDCLKKVCIEAELQSPDLITSTNLRKYIATVIQLFNLSENETDWLARHLGHDVRVHRQYYRTQEEIIETTKVSRLLLAVEQGKAHLFHGKKLKDINVDLLDYSDDSEVEEDGEETIPEREDPGDVPVCSDVRNHKKQKKSITIEAESSPNANVKKPSRKEAIESLPDEGSFTKRLKIQRHPINSSSDSEEDFSESKVITKRTSKVKKSCDKKPWTSAEKETVLTYFRTNISKGIIPRKEQCDSCKIGSNNVLKNRSWKDIKYYIYNHIKKVQKHMK